MVITGCCEVVCRGLGHRRPNSSLCLGKGIPSKTGWIRFDSSPKLSRTTAIGTDPCYVGKLLELRSYIHVFVM